jgi:hypothetical protein
MIRIDEIYDNTFWPWLERNCPGTRLFFCDPPGNTSPDALFNLGSDDIVENNYVFMHDQEPVDLELYRDLFDKVCKQNTDLWAPGPPEYYDNKPYVVADLTHYITDDKGRPVKPTPHGHVIVSERGEFVDALCQKYEWTPHYYFYHGWACLDWFRGYDQTFLIHRARDRRPTRTFMSPNRIVGGRRDHRVIFLYHVFKNHLQHNHISAPRVCQYEGIDITSIAQKYTNVYQDIVTALDQADLPKLFSGEQQQHMHSHRLGNFTEVADSLIYVPTETVYFGRRTHITEKTFKAIALEMPFVLVAPAGSLEYLREYGFKTFSAIFDENYDTEINDIHRIERVIKLLKDLDSLTVKEQQQIHRACLPVIEHNFNHFYRGGFAEILWSEMNHMLNTLQKTLT